jgi:hypothetical protein
MTGRARGSEVSAHPAYAIWLKALAPPDQRHTATWSPVCKQIGLSVVFGASGQLIGIDDLTVRSGMKPAERRMLVPRIAETSNSMSVNFLWDRCRYALGARRRPNAAYHYCLDDPTLQGLTRFYHHMLGETQDLSLKAFLKFLDHRSPAVTEAIPILEDSRDPNVVFRFQYDDDFLHNLPAARRIWQPSVDVKTAHSGINDNVTA